jgi:hypothetical protein
VLQRRDAHVARGVGDVQEVRDKEQEEVRAGRDESQGAYAGQHEGREGGPGEEGQVGAHDGEVDDEEQDLNNKLELVKKWFVKDWLKGQF